MSSNSSNTYSPLLIVGTGSLACLFAARLSAASIPVTLLGSWPEGIAALRRYGVRLVDADGTTQSYPVKVSNAPAECSQTRLALVLVKSWQTGRAAQRLGECLAPDGLALTLQNGLGNVDALASVLGRSRVAAGVTALGAHLLDPGRVQAIGGDGDPKASLSTGAIPEIFATSVTVGEHPQVGDIIGLLRIAGLSVGSVSDLPALLWGKLVVNAAINPLTALLRVANGELLERPSARELMAEAACEAMAVAAAAGIRIPYPDPIQVIETVIRRTAANYSSMLQDVLRGAPTEVDTINGVITRAGEQIGLHTPVNAVLWWLVKGLMPHEDPMSRYPVAQTLLKLSSRLSSEAAEDLSNLRQQMSNCRSDGEAWDEDE